MAPAHRAALFTALRAVLAALVASPALGAQTSAGFHAVHVTPDPGGGAETKGFLHGRLELDGRLVSWEWAVGGGVWLDLGRIDASVLAPLELTVGRGWSWGALRAGIGAVPWGLSPVRSPAAQLDADALLWNTVSGPALTGPLLEGAAFGTAGEIQVVLLPLRRPTPVGRLVNVTWDGRRVPARESWETEAGYAVRFSRSFAAVDAAVWWMDAGDRRPWIGTAEDGAARPDHPRTRQAGYALEWVVGPTVLRSEGGLARRGRSWHSRVILGVEWFATPYLTLLLEQGLASDRDQAASPLVDDALLTAQVLAEVIRFQGGLAVDPVSGTRHLWSTLRWTVGDRSALELEWVEAWGDADSESPAALRQPRALRIGGVWYF